MSLLLLGIEPKKKNPFALPFFFSEKGGLREDFLGKRKGGVDGGEGRERERERERGKKNAELKGKREKKTSRD